MTVSKVEDIRLLRTEWENHAILTDSDNFLLYHKLYYIIS